MVVDFFACDKEILKSKRKISSCLLKAAKAGRANVLQSVFHEFREKGKGITGVLLLAESHISIHTWPEHQMAAIDVFACGKVNLDPILEILKRHLLPGRYRIKTLLR